MMKRLLLLLVLMAGCASPVVNLVTPSIALLTSNDGVSCKAINVTNAPQTVRVQLVNGDGTVQFDSGNQSLSPNGAFLFVNGHFDPARNQTEYYCRFTASKRTVLGWIVYISQNAPWNGGPVLILPAR